MALVTFNENVDHYVKGDVVDLDKAEQKRVDNYATERGIEKPYSKGAKEVSNTSETPSLQDQAAAASLKKGVKPTSNDKTDDERDLKGGVENQEDLVENANRQAQGETLPGQEGDNPSEIDNDETVNDDDAADESDQDDESESDDDQGSDEDKADEGTTTDDVEETETATELESDNDTPAEGTDKAKKASK